MPLTPNLFGVVSPPELWVHLKKPTTMEHVDRILTVRVKEEGARSFSASINVDCYSPEWSIFRAVSDCLENLALMQQPVTKGLLQRVLETSAKRWVEPF